MQIYATSKIFIIMRKSVMEKQLHTLVVYCLVCERVSNQSKSIRHMQGYSLSVCRYVWLCV